MATRPLDVLVVAPHAIRGGQERWVLQLLDSTDRLRVRVILLQDGELRTEFEQRQIPVEIVPVGVRPRDLWAPILNVTRRLRAAPPDVVVANGVKAQVVAGPAARLAGVPLVFVRHDHAFENLVGPLSVLADRVVGTSAEVLTAVGRPDSLVIPPPLPEPALSRSAARDRLSELGLPNDGSLTLGMATRVVSSKGIEDAIRALALPGSQGWRLVVLGGADPSEPNESGRLVALAAELGVAERVRLLGYITDAPTLVRAFDALGVLTRAGGSRGPGGEGFGMVALEAMAAGVAVIAVGGGAVERRLGGTAGLTVSSADPRAVAAALSELAVEARRRELGSAGERLAAGHPELAETSDQFCAILSETARRPGAGLQTFSPVSVVVPLFNEAAGVVRSLTALLGQLREGDELVAVDDASSDSTGALLRSLSQEHPELRILSLTGNRGAAGARNAGIEAARHDLLVCTDAGNELPELWLESMRAALGDHQQPDLVAGGFAVSTGTLWERVMAASLYPDVADVRQPGPVVQIYSRFFGRRFSADRPAGRSLAFRREAWARVGGFRTDLRTAEDTAFGLAVAKAGPCVVQTDSPVVWQQHPSVRATARMFFTYGRGDGLQAERVVILRNTARAVAVLVAPVLLVRGAPWIRAGVVGGACAYLSLPIWKLRKDRQPVAAMSLVPVALATKDVAKAVGCAAGLMAGRKRRS